MSLEVDGLSVDIDGTRIVHDVSFTVPTGTTFALLGPNGSGKSTLINSLCRVLRPSAGRVLVDDEDLLALSARDAARRVAVVAQDSSIEFDFTALELVLVGRHPHKGLFERDAPSDLDAVEGALEAVGCLPLARRRVSTLSGGERQRVLLARALAQGADHLILDEPTNHLDVRFQVQVLELVAGLPVTTLAALHDLSHAALYADEVALLEAGRLVGAGRPSEVITAERVGDVYGVDVLVLDHPEGGSPVVVPRRRVGFAAALPAASTAGGLLADGRPTDPASAHRTRTTINQEGSPP